MKLDRKIVRLLIGNARISYSDLGGAGGDLPGGGPHAGCRRWKKKGVIEEYTTVVNPQKISGAVSCYFEIETRPETLAEVAALLEGNETVTQIYRVTGKSKLHVHAVAASAGEMEQLMTGVIDRLPGVVCCDCNMILSRIKDIKGLRL